MTRCPRSLSVFLLALSWALFPPPRLAPRAGDAAPAGPLPELVESALPVTARMWGRDSKNYFWRDARGGKEFREIYRSFETTRNRDNLDKGKGCVNDAAYDPAADAASTLLCRPAGFAVADASQWGVYLHISDPANRASDIWKNISALKPVFAERKLVYVAPNFSRIRSDVYVMCVALDALKTAFDACPGLASSKRIFVGGDGDGGRVAGLLAMNFAKIGRSGWFSGYFAIGDLALRNMLVELTERISPSRSYVFSNTRRISDTVGFSNKDWPPLAKAVRVVGFTAGAATGAERSPSHSFMVRGMYDYLIGDFKVRLFDSPSGGLTPEIFAGGLDWLSGKNIPISPVRSNIYDIVWPAKDK